MDGGSRGYCNNQTIGFYSTQNDMDMKQNRIGGLTQCRGCESKVRCDWRCQQYACEYFGSFNEAVDSCSGCDAAAQCHPAQNCYGNKDCWQNNQPEFGSDCAESCKPKIRNCRDKKHGKCWDWYDQSTSPNHGEWLNVHDWCQNVFNEDTFKIREDAQRHFEANSGGSLNASTYAIMTARAASGGIVLFKAPRSVSHCEDFMTGTKDQACIDKVNSFNFVDMCMGCNGDWNEHSQEVKIVDECIAAHSVASCRTDCVAETCRHRKEGGTPGCHDTYWALEHGRSDGRDWVGGVTAIGENGAVPKKSPQEIWALLTADASGTFPGAGAGKFGKKCSNCRHCHADMWDGRDRGCQHACTDPKVVNEWEHCNHQDRTSLAGCEREIHRRCGSCTAASPVYLEMGDVGNGYWMVTNRVMAGCHGGNLPALPEGVRQLTEAEAEAEDTAAQVKYAEAFKNTKLEKVPEHSSLGMAFASAVDEKFVLGLALNPIRRASYLSRRKLAEKTLAGQNDAELRMLREVYSAEHLLKERENLQDRGDAMVKDVKEELRKLFEQAGEADHLEARNAYKFDQYNHYMQELDTKLGAVLQELRTERRNAESKRKLSELMDGTPVYSRGPENSLKQVELESERHRLEASITKYRTHYEHKMLRGASRHVATLRLDVAERKRKLAERIEGAFVEERRRLASIERETMTTARKTTLSYKGASEFERDVLLGKTALDTRRKLAEAVAHSHLTLYENLFQRNFFPHAYELVTRDTARLSAEARRLSEVGEEVTAGDLATAVPIEEQVRSSRQIMSKAQSSVLARRMLEMLQLGAHPLADYGIYNADHPIHDDYGRADEMKGSSFVSRQLSEDGLSIRVNNRRALSPVETLKNAAESDTDYGEEDQSAEALSTGSRKAANFAMADEFSTILTSQGQAISGDFPGWEKSSYDNSVGVIGSPRRQLALNSYQNDRFLARVEELLASRAPAHLTEEEARRLEELDIEKDYHEGEGLSGVPQRRLMSSVQVSTECTSNVAGECAAMHQKN